MIWYAIRCALQRELIAEEVLRASGYHTFCPRMKRSGLRRNGFRQSWDVAMMPGYLFCAHVVPWEEIRTANIRGERLMYRALGHDGTPSPIPDESVQAIRKFDGAKVYVRDLQVGDRVSVRTGAYDTRIVTVTAVDRDRIQVAMTMLGALRNVEVDKGQVEAA